MLFSRSRHLAAGIKAKVPLCPLLDGDFDFTASISIAIGCRCNYEPPTCISCLNKGSKITCLWHWNVQTDQILHWAQNKWPLAQKLGVKSFAPMNDNPRVRKIGFKVFARLCLSFQDGGQSGQRSFIPPETLFKELCSRDFYPPKGENGL